MTPPLHSRRQTWLAAAAYAALTVVMTWPIAGDAVHGVPADLGDSLLNMWIMAWVTHWAIAFAQGAMSFADLWNANIFHPFTATLTFSEHLVPQALQGAPIYLATGNIVLAYNVVFLATFALSALGVFLCVREFTGSAAAAFVAGLFYGFAPYRLGQFPHIQTISSQWMPFALYGLRRYFVTGRRGPLWWGAFAFVVQGLSTGYYLFFFAPILLGYALWEMWSRQRLRDADTWIALATAGGAAVAVLLPFLMPYVEARTHFGFSRPFGEVLFFSANLLAYLNAPPQLHLWGPVLNQHPQAEGDLFPGLVPVMFALAAVALWLARYVAAVRAVPFIADARGRRALRWLAIATGVALVVMVLVGVTGGIAWDLGPLPVRVTSPRRAFKWALLFGAGALLLASRLRTRPLARSGDLTPFFAAATLVAVWLSLGPMPRLGEVRLEGFDVYKFLYDFVPGYDGLRVPARFAMVATLALALTAGPALAALARWGRAGAIALVLCAGLFLAEGYAAPVPMNLSWSSSTRFVEPWPTVQRLNDGPLAYRHVLLMPEDTVLLEMPFGDPGWDLRYVYYAGLHGKRIVNGYSGYFPDGYRARGARLANVWKDREAAWASLMTSGATHILVHERAYPPPEGEAISGFVTVSGGRLVAEFSDGDRLFALPRH